MRLVFVESTRLLGSLDSAVSPDAHALTSRTLRPVWFKIQRSCPAIASRF